MGGDMMFKIGVILCSFVILLLFSALTVSGDVRYFGKDGKEISAEEYKNEAKIFEKKYLKEQFKQHRLKRIVHEDSELKDGWTSELIEIATGGCVYGMLKTTLEDYKQRGLEKGHQVPTYEIEKVKQLIFPLVEKTCKCTMERVAQKWSYDEIEQIKNKNSKEIDLYIQDLFANGQCPLPIPDQRQINDLRKSLQVKSE